MLCIFRQMCLAVARVHEQGLIHRDIHPTRINLIGTAVKLNLVGMPYNFKKLFKSETFCGHLNYSAPETLADDVDQLTEKVDIWALGCCLYFLAVKRDPFEAATPDEIKRNIRNLQIDGQGVPRSSELQSQ
jgi:serine/threonine protein kinase